jgi:hypothetical protein
MSAPNNRPHNQSTLEVTHGLIDTDGESALPANGGLGFYPIGAEVLFGTNERPSNVEEVVHLNADNESNESAALEVILAITNAKIKQGERHAD